MIYFQLYHPHIEIYRCRPLIFIMQEPYIYYEGVELINAIHTHPSILILQPRITTNHGKNIVKVKLMLFTFNLNKHSYIYFLGTTNQELTLTLSQIAQLSWIHHYIRLLLSKPGLFSYTNIKFFLLKILFLTIHMNTDICFYYHRSQQTLSYIYTVINESL